ncbi:cytochrome P450 [Aspergillus japonicus CBS 114.51]|uniref:Cytochrome P450 n=2 Tax=Aspergillus TaxID=5052 RepID=A0A2V5IW09_ASPV1|nr:cytochrome P450 [Aspergillus japonicus CBS 114.51]PYI24336.1 cytochrome P450 [Aspergillus violaceofuscus CBS 115571]RAH82857.1 cytochrome P450 [Aspergillus japonicus CBS 114.51]
MLTLIALVSGALYLTFQILRSIQQTFRNRRTAKSLGCEPPRKIPSDPLGLKSFFELARAAKDSRVVEYIAGFYEQYGPTFSLTGLGGVSILSTVEPENLKALLATQFHDFSLGTRHREFYPLLGDGIFTLDGAGWSHARALLRPQFTRDQVADLDLMDGHVSRLIELIPKNGCDFDIQRLFFLLTIDSATHFLFGESVNAMHSSSHAGVLEKTTVGDAQGFAEAFNLSQEYLFTRNRFMDLYWLVNPKEFQDANKRVHEVVDHYVRLALASKNNPAKTADRYIFAEALAAETDDPRVLRDNMLNILLAGRDTTASLLSSAFFYLARHPAVWDRLRRAVIEEFGDSVHPRAKITQARLKDIPYLRYFLNEVLRLLPPVPLNFRVAVKDTSLPVGGGPDGKAPVFIRKGQLVTYSVYAMHRREDLYGPDARSFRPERWEENAIRGWDFLPFNGGPRICLGQQYALTEASYTLVRLLQHFDRIENAAPAVEEPRIMSNLTLSHLHGVDIRLYPAAAS